MSKDEKKHKKAKACKKQAKDKHAKKAAASKKTAKLPAKSPKKKTEKPIEIERIVLAGCTCPCCKKRCPLMKPKCGKGKAIRAKKLKTAA